jgi:hypothetical protein
MDAKRRSLDGNVHDVRCR